MITLFSVRPKGFNVGNDAIFLGVRHLLREAFGGFVNIVQVPAVESAEEGSLSGLKPRTIHEMNRYGHGVVVGGGNIYENGQLTVDAHALTALRPPLMLFSLSHGRIYDRRKTFVERTDSMPIGVIRHLNEKAMISLARDEATLAYLQNAGIDKAVLGGCPTLLLSRVELPRMAAPSASTGTLLCLRNPQLMSIPLASQARLHKAVVDILDTLNALGHGPVRILCHDTRDVAFASSFEDVEYIVPDDVYSHLELLRSARLVVTFRLHAFLPALSYGTPAINISYDERSVSLVKTIGYGSWDIDYVKSADLLSDIRDRCHRLSELPAIREAAQPRWQLLEGVMRESMTAFAESVNAYASEPLAG